MGLKMAEEYVYIIISWQHIAGAHCHITTDCHSPLVCVHMRACMCNGGEGWQAALYASIVYARDRAVNNTTLHTGN